MFLILVKVDVNSNLIIHHSLNANPQVFNSRNPKVSPAPATDEGEKWPVNRYDMMVERKMKMKMNDRKDNQMSEMDRSLFVF